MRRLLWLLPLLAACGSPPRDGDSPPKKTSSRTPSRTTTRPAKQPAAYGDTRPIPQPTEDEVKEFARIWEYYRKEDPRWPLERDRFKRRSDAAGYLMAVYLLQHYMQLNAVRERAGKQLVRAKNEIVAVGEPCAPPLVDMMVLDSIPRKDAPDFLVDDITRQDCLDMLERMGPQAVPALLGVYERKGIGPKGRRLTALALGGTKDPRAYDTLVRLLKEDPEWQVRADAATALGRLGDRRAAQPLAEAIRKDADRTVVERARKARLELLAGAAR